jgi:hypothetical protein
MTPLLVFGPTLGWSVGLIASGIVGLANFSTAVVAVTFGNSPNSPVQFRVAGRSGDFRDMVRSTVVGGLIPAFTFAVLASLALGPLVGIAGSVVVGTASGLVVGLVRWSVPAENANAANAISVLNRDRRAAFFNGFGVSTLFTLTFAVILSQRYPVAEALLVALVAGVIGGSGFTLGTSWAWFHGARIWLAIRGDLPWHLMAFLDDSHRRGVLRLSGATYQFRHGRLQDHLAGVTPAEWRRPSPVDVR